MTGKFLKNPLTHPLHPPRPVARSTPSLEIAGASLHNLKSIDLRVPLGRPQRNPNERPMNVVVATEHGPVSMLVDDVSEVLDLDEEAVERPPSTLGASTRDLIVGAYKLDGRLLLELDLDAVIANTGPSGIDAEVDER